MIYRAGISFFHKDCANINTEVAEIIGRVIRVAVSTFLIVTSYIETSGDIHDSRRIETASKFFLLLMQIDRRVKAETKRKSLIGRIMRILKFRHMTMSE